MDSHAGAQSRRLSGVFQRDFDIKDTSEASVFCDSRLNTVDNEISPQLAFGDFSRYNHRILGGFRGIPSLYNGVASMLARLGVRAGERVAMLIGNRMEFIEFFFGSMRAGAIPLPLNTRLAADTLEHIITEAACALAVIDPSSHRDALAIAQRLPLRQRLILDYDTVNSHR